MSDESFANDDRILPISIKGQEGFIIDAINLEAFRKVVFERILTAVPNDRTRVQYQKAYCSIIALMNLQDSWAWNKATHLLYIMKNMC